MISGNSENEPWTDTTEEDNSVKLLAHTQFAVPSRLPSCWLTLGLQFQAGALMSIPMSTRYDGGAPFFFSEAAQTQDLVRNEVLRGHQHPTTILRARARVLGVSRLAPEGST